MSSITVHNKKILILIQKQLLKVFCVLDTKDTGRGMILFTQAVHGLRRGQMLYKAVQYNRFHARVKPSIHLGK